MGYAFISYSSKNLDKADEVRNYFLSKNIDCWMAPYNIPTGSNWAATINDAIEECACLVLILTEEAQKSDNVDKEINLALSNDKILIPVRFENFKLSSSFKYYLTNCQIETVEKIENNDIHITKVLESVAAYTGVSKSEKEPEKKEAEKTSEFVTLIDEYGFKYVGQIKNDQKHGKGTEYWDNGSKQYEGDFAYGRHHGKGSFYYADESLFYEGDWINGLYHGKGTRFFENGDRYTGEWKNGWKDGYGTYYYADGRTEEQYYENDVLKVVDGKNV